jgi:Cu(I)/Ag(I) efflux system membrane fusion protein
MKRLRSIFALIVALAALSSCSTGDKAAEKTLTNTPESFKAQFTSVLNNYFELKDALVETNAEEAQRAANEFKNALEQADEQILSEQLRADWAMEKQTLQEATIALQETADVEKQREHFQTISNTMATAVSRYGIKEGTVYQQYCPMAFNDTGALWLAKEKKIANPYFGDRMLRCGEVQKEISF